MPRIKAPYKGALKVAAPRGFSDSLRAELRKFYPDQTAPADKTFGHPADGFVEELLAAGRWARDQVAWEKSGTTRQENAAELRDLTRLLTKTRTRLRAISPDLDRLLGVDADPLGVADSIDVLIGQCNGAANQIPKQTRRHGQAKNAIARELAVRVLRILKDHGIKPSATMNPYHGNISTAVQVLSALGDEVGLPRADLTWRDLIASVKK